MIQGLSKIRIAVVEDEAIFSSLIVKVLNAHGYTVAWLASDVDAAMTGILQNDFDLLLLDIGLNDKNSGLTLGKLVASHCKKPFIYITSYIDPDIIAEALKTKPSAYISKPINELTLVATLQCAINNYQNQTPASPVGETDQSFFFVKTGPRYKKLFWNEIGYLMADKNYTHIYNTSDKQRYALRAAFSRVLGAFIPPKFQEQFVQINRSTAVNLSHVTDILSDEQVQTPFGIFPVTNSHLEAVKKRLNILI